MSKFDLIASEWDTNPMRKELSVKVLAEINKNVEFNSLMDVLDYGTGTGLILLGIQPFVNSVTGMDNSAGMLDVLSEKVKTADLKNVSFQKHDIDLEDLGTEQFDMIVSSMTLHHISNTDGFFQKAYKALKKGGKICIADLVSEDGNFHPEKDEGVKHHGFDIILLKSIIEKNNFKSVKMYPFYSINKNVGTELNPFPVFMAVAEK